PTRGTVVRLTWTEHEVATVIGLVVRRAGEFDVIDLCAVGAGNSLPYELFAHPKGEVRQSVDISWPDLWSLTVHQEKPIAAPGDIARDAPQTGHFNSDPLAESITRHVFNSDPVPSVSLEPNNADRSLQPVRSGSDSPQVQQRDDQPDRPVSAHTEVGDVV